MGTNKAQGVDKTTDETLNTGRQPFFFLNEYDNKYFTLGVELMGEIIPMLQELSTKYMMLCSYEYMSQHTLSDRCVVGVAHAIDRTNAFIMNAEKSSGILNSMLNIMQVLYNEITFSHMDFSWVPTGLLSQLSEEGFPPNICRDVRMF